MSHLSIGCPTLVGGTRRHDLPGPSRTITTDETIDDVEAYFEENPNSSVRKAAQVMTLKRETLRKIVKDVIKLHPYKITTHQLLTKKAMEKWVQFCEVIIDMFENEELDEKRDYFLQMKLNFWLNGIANCCCSDDYRAILKSLAQG
ncbi:hypothetical protein X777_16405 [Ooceraea biroi]|uniref:HTH psq-type domain-containing protein n=1 Tax=Ooceraea biroi TaxID=2015173 RepID=A0A026WVM3_OOCBI|nr:hypothetical protein X777_16405 [Ooceraea biroi]